MLGLGGGPKARQREQYRTYVETAVREGLEKSPWGAVLEQVALGGREFLKTVCGRIAGAAQAGERLKRRSAVRPDWVSVLASVERVKGEKWEAFRERHGDRGRDMALWLGRREGGLTLRELAQLAELKGDAAVAVSLKRYAAILRDDPKERDRLQAAIELLIVRS